MNNFIIEADGGTSCNIPRLGFGEGYGSYQINGGEIKKVKFGVGHSNNSAEIRTIVEALRDLANNDSANEFTVLIRSDSEIALKWVTCKKAPKLTSTENFRTAIELLRAEVIKFKQVKTEWRGRAHSVKLFGH